MYTRLLIAIGLLALGGISLAQAYRWVDDQGVVHYSDRPQPGAEEIQLSDSEPRSRPDVPIVRSAPQRQEAADQPEEPAGYTSLEFVEPESEQTLWNIGGVLNVTLSLTPTLKAGDRVRVYYDGEPMDVNGTTFRIREVYRGEHNLQAEIVNPQGELLIRSEPTRFYVQQTSILN